jgi:predicted  nucleic acid-binding Zn-ribbon protein
MDPQTQRFVEMESEIKALREELHRQRTQIVSAETNITNQQQNVENEMRQLENRVINTQNECEYYKKLVKDACSRFKEISKFKELDDSVKLVIMNWFESIENVCFYSLHSSSIMLIL